MPCRPQDHTQPQQQCTRFPQRCHCLRGRVPCCRTRAPLLLEGQEQQLEPSSPSTTTCGECSACCAGRKATHSRNSSALAPPAMPLPERPRTVLSHTRTSPPRGTRATARALLPQAPPLVVSAPRAVQAARPYTAAAAVHSLLPAMLLPERPRTVLSHTRTSPPRGARATARAPLPMHHHLW